MSDKLFTGRDGGVPFPRTKTEWMNKGLSPDAAEHRMAQDVFGTDYSKDSSGQPIERGKGSALQPTQQHRQAIDIQESARRSRGGGWSPAIEGAFDPRIQAAIDAAVEARLRESRKPRRKQARKPKAQAEQPAA